ncbi:hypothetical protein ACA910_004834 [Epithemia clementina (nom. ined.)]
MKLTTKRVNNKTSEQESEEDNIAEDEFVVHKDDVLSTRLFDESEEYYTDKKPAAATKRKFSEITAQVGDGERASSHLSSARSSTILPSTLVNAETTNNTATACTNNSNDVINNILQFALSANLAHVQEIGR